MPLATQPVAAGLYRPVFVTAPPGDRQRLFIVEQHTGHIRVLRLGEAVSPTPFLQIPGVATGNEQGLLGLAFHPDYTNNGFFYVNVVLPGGGFGRGVTQVRRYKVSAADPDRADPATATTVLTVDQPFENHNGGWLGFGRDGFLYVALGDGGSANDPGNRAQNLNELLGKLLRIDIDGDDFPGDAERNYKVPPSNPFVGRAGARPEIWASGLRNPWRCGFDRETGDLYLGDVGQAEREEIDFQAAQSRGGENYGWRLKEGTRVTGFGLVVPGLVDPIHEYTHDNGEQAVVGGYVYRGAIAALRGTYFFADYTGLVWSMRYDGVVATQLTQRESELFPDSSPRVVSFGENGVGELYVVTHSPGAVHRIVFV